MKAWEVAGAIVVGSGMYIVVTGAVLGYNYKKHMRNCTRFDCGMCQLRGLGSIFWPITLVVVLGWKLCFSGWIAIAEKIFDKVEGRDG